MYFIIERALDLFFCPIPPRADRQGMANQSAFMYIPLTQPNHVAKPIL